MRKDSPAPSRVAGVLLAAGAGRRFGGGKLVALLDGEPLVRHAARHLLVAHLDEVVVVTDASHDDVARALAGFGGPGLRLVPNLRAADGMGTSLAAGISALGHDVAAAVVALGDQPRLPEGVAHALVAAWRGSGTPIVAPRYRGGVRGHPVLFDASVFRELRALAGDEGARGIIARSADRVRLVDVDAPPPGDVDTPEDLARLAAPDPGA